MINDHEIKLGFINDEVSQDPKVFIDFAKRHSIKYIELRTAFGKNLKELSFEEIESIVKDAENSGIRIVALSSPVFKCNMDDEKEIEENIKLFGKLCEISAKLNIKYIRGFDFWANSSSIEERKEMFDPIIKLCEKYSVTYLLEYDPSVNSSDAKKTAEMVTAISDPHIKALYDAGNAIWSDPNAVPYPNDYNTLKPVLKHIHIKDAIIVNGKAKAVKVGTGLCDYKGLFKELIKTQYQGYVMLETHYRLNKEISEELMKNPGGNSFSDGSLEASEESMLSLKKIIDEARNEI